MTAFAMDVDKLIDLVHQRRALWDKEDSSHRDRYMLHTLWEEVAQEMSYARKYNSFSQLQHVHEV
jgi:hypothetical protein